MGASGPPTERGRRKRRRHATSAADQRARLEKFTELSQEALFIHEEGIIHDVNPAAARMVGVPPRQLIGKHVFTLVSAESLSYAKAQMDIKPTGPYELLLVRRDGTRFWAELQGRSLSWLGKTMRVVTARDVTARKRAEAALHDSEALFRQLAENIKEVFFVRDLRENRMIYVSPSYEEIWQRPRQRLMEDPLDFVQSIHPEDRATVLDALRRGAPGYFRQEYRIVRVNDEVRWIRARTFPIMNAAGEVHRIAGIAEDITDFKHAELERLEHEKAQREALVREVHHRIKNNLQGIIGLLQYEMGGHPALREVMQGTISQIRSIAVIYGLQSQTPGRDLLLCDVVPAVIGAVCESREPRPQIALQTDLPRSLKLLEPNAVPIALVINELMTNAVKHGPALPRAHIEVHLKQQGEGGCIVVRTRGARLPVGFDFQMGQGLGTGLHLVKSLLPRQGTTLTIAQNDEAVWTELVLLPPVVEPLPRPDSGAG